MQIKDISGKILSGIGDLVKKIESDFHAKLAAIRVELGAVLPEPSTDPETPNATTTTSSTAVVVPHSSPGVHQTGHGIMTLPSPTDITLKRYCFLRKHVSSEDSDSVGHETTLEDPFAEPVCACCGLKKLSQCDCPDDLTSTPTPESARRSIII